MVQTRDSAEVFTSNGGQTVYERVAALCQEAESWRKTDARRGLTLTADALDLIRDAELTPRFTPTVTHHLAEAQSRLTRGHCLERLSEYQAAIEEGQAALRLTEAAMELAATKEEEREARLACAGIGSLLGNVYDRMGDFVASLGYRRQNLEILTELGRRRDRAHALLQLGAGYYRLADYPTTLDCYQEALTICQACDDQLGEGSAWNGIGNVQYSQGLYEDAADSYRRGLEVFEGLGEPYWQGGLLGNIAGAHLELGRLAEARDAALRSLILRTRISDRHGQGYAHDCLARIYHRMGRYPKAREAALRSLSLFEEVNDRTGMVYAAKSLAQACMELEDYSVALRYCRTALVNAEEIGLRELVYQMCELLSRLHERQGDYACALEYYKRFHTAREALFNDENDRRLRNLRTLHEVEQARREADLARQHSELLKQANVRQAELLAQLQTKSQELERQARTDALTGLMNRRYFELCFAEAFAEAVEQGKPLSVALLDADHFKTVNDRFSHPVGDVVLRTLARLLQQNCRAGDVAARYGGEEFILVFTDTDLSEAATLGERIRATVQEYSWSDLHPDLAVTVSIGICADMDVPRSDKMLSCADEKLYEAKAAGRNCVRC